MLGTLICEAVLVISIFRAVGKIESVTQLLERLLNAWREGSKSASVAGQYYSGPIGQGKGSGKLEVQELPPEVLAPRLRKPPRPPGGFGSKIMHEVEDTNKK